MWFERTIRNAEDVFDQMRESGIGIEPEVTSFSILLHVNSRAHMPQLVLDQLRLMKEKGICPNVVMYTSVIKCLASCGWLEDAERLLEEMVILEGESFSWSCRADVITLKFFLESCVLLSNFSLIGSLIFLLDM